jgi:hypothetical protein
MKFTCVSDPDPHLFGFLECGSGSRSVKSAKVERKNGVERKKIHHKKVNLIYESIIRLMTFV